MGFFYDVMREMAMRIGGNTDRKKARAKRVSCIPSRLRVDIADDGCSGIGPPRLRPRLMLLDPVVQ